MATNYIKIEVDYGNSKVKIGDLKMGFDELGEKATATRNRINKAYKSTENAMKGSLKALTREREGWINLQQSLSTTNAAYSKYQAQIDKLDAKIAKITDTRRKEEKALKNSANGLRAQIAAMQTEMDNRILSNKQYRIANEQLQQLKDRLDALTDTRKEHEIVQEGSVAHYEQEIQVQMERLRNMNLEQHEIEETEQKIASLTARKAEAAAKSTMLNKAMAGTSSSAGAAGSAVTEFGRTIGDAPFGLMGMANNIQQLSQQFVDLSNKSGGTKQALQSMLQTMIGPAGVVVAINIITSALVAYNMKKDKAKEKTEDFNEQLLIEKNTLEALNDLYRNGEDLIENRVRIMGALAAADDKYAEALDKIGINEEQRRLFTEDYLDKRMALNEAEDKRNKIAEKYKDQLKQELISEEALNKEREEINKIEDPAVYAGRMQALGQKINRNNELKEILGEVSDATIAAADAQNELNKILEASALDDAKKDLAAYVEELRILQNFKEGPERLAEELRVLKEDLAKEAVRAGTTETAAYQEILLSILEKERELYEAQEEIKQESHDKEKDRLASLAELNQEYTDNLEAQGDELGIIRLNQAERDAIAEAKALGASKDLIMKIEQDFANQRQAILDEDANERAEKAEKAAKKQADKEKKIREEALKENLQTIGEYFDKEVELMQERTNRISEILSGFSTIMDELGNMSQHRFERQIGRLNEERDLIKQNDDLTKQEKEQQLTDLQRKENNIQRNRIKAEYNMFAVKQMFSIMEMAMKERAMFRERMLMKQKFIEETRLTQLSIIQEQLKAGLISGVQAQIAINGVNLKAAENMAGANMSLGSFMANLGPLGIAAFALSIGGVIASIVSAKRKGQAEIASLSDAPVNLGGSSGQSASKPAVPDFNVVGASGQNQLAEAIGASNNEPLRAYVVSSDVTSAQEMDRKIVEGASI